MASTAVLARSARRIVLLISAALFSLGMISASKLGLAWDEANFIPSGLQHLQAVQEWLKHPTEKNLGSDPRWEWTWEHPPLIKCASALSLSLLYRSLGGLVAARIPMLLILGLLPLGAFLAGRELAGESAGLWAALLTATSPRLVGHLIVVGLDGPLAAFTLLFVAVTLRNTARETGIFRGSLAAGLLLGICLLIKFNAFFLFPVAWICSFRGKPSSRWPRLLFVLGIALLIGYLGSPYLWHDAPRRVTAYFLSKFHRSSVPVHYLGQTYADAPTAAQAPWHYPFVLLWSTTPPLVLLAALIGLFSPVCRKRVRPLIVLTACFLLPCCAPQTPKYDGIRLFLPAAASLTVMGGVGLDKMARWLNSALQLPVPLTVFGSFLLSVLPLLSIHPYYLSYYSPVVGGLPGAERLGLEITYWGECLGPDAIHAVQKEKNLSLLRVDPVGGNVCPLSANMGLLPKDMDMVRLAETGSLDPPRDAPNEKTAIALICRKGEFEEVHWKLFRKERPFMAVTAQETPLVRFYMQEQLDRVLASFSDEVHP